MSEGPFLLEPQRGLPYLSTLGVTASCGTCLSRWCLCVWVPPCRDDLVLATLAEAPYLNWAHRFWVGRMGMCQPSMATPGLGC